MNTHALDYIEFQITARCQYACNYCGSSTPNHHLEPSFDKIKEILDRVNPKKVSFTGGEPTLRWDLLLELIDYSHIKGIITQLNTNAKDLTRTMIRELQEAGLDIFHVSLSTLKQ